MEDKPESEIDDVSLGANTELRDIVEKESASTKLVEESDANLVAVPVDAVPLNLPLPCSLYIKVADRYPLFRKQGEKLNSKRIVALAEKGAASLYIHKAVWKFFLSSLERTAFSPGAPKEVVATQLRGLIVAYGTELERKIKEPKKPLFEKLRVLSEALAASIQRDPAIGVHLLRKSSEPMHYFVNHAVNSAVYSTVIGTKMNYSWDDLKLLAYAALVHDIGNLFLPKTLLYKKSDLTQEEKDEMQTHTRRGAEVLQLMGSAPAVVLTALQHHERMDGKGYPQALEPIQIHNFARIVAVADTYDALTSNKPYQAAMPPREAIEKMKSLTGKFDPKIIGAVTGAAASGTAEFAKNPPTADGKNAA